ncbi:hypothetical protein E0H22_13350 [Rhodopseudomonas boonkerdii]|nr:hypothetical protein E0H22_13350 [Rhodopseudomonas boonkerdii]
MTVPVELKKTPPPGLPPPPPPSPLVLPIPNAPSVPPSPPPPVAFRKTPETPGGAGTTARLPTGTLIVVASLLVPPVFC